MKFWNQLKARKGLALGWLTMGAFVLFGPTWLNDLKSPLAGGLFSLWLLPAILGAAFSVVREADAVAHRLGEPLGTLVLTISVTGMEVSMLAAVMLTGREEPTLARDTMFAVVMIVLCGLVGSALLLGAWRHRQQEFNLEGAAAYLSLILPLSLFGLVMPNFTVTTAGPTFSTNQSIVLAVLCVAIYAVFLCIQTMRHREFFAHPAEAEGENGNSEAGLWGHLILLVVSLVPVVVLSEELAHVLDFGVNTLHLPHALAGVVVAGLILAPEGLSSIQAAWNNQIQRAVNILLGSVLATISLTIPAVLVIGVLSGRKVILGLEPHETVMLAIALAISLMTFGRGKTNILQGAVHLLVFIVWFALIFES